MYSPKSKSPSSGSGLHSQGLGSPLPKFGPSSPTSGSHSPSEADTCSCLTANGLAATLPVFISTGISAADEVLGGGLPCGHITEICGESGAGKSWFALRCIASAQSQGLSCLIIDTECAFDARWAIRQGVAPDALVLLRPGSFQVVQESVEEALYKKLANLLVIDSLDGLQQSSALGNNSNAPSLYSFLPHLQTMVEGSGAACLITSQFREVGGAKVTLANDVMRQCATVRALLSIHSQSLHGLQLSLQVKRHNLLSECNTAALRLTF